MKQLNLQKKERKNWKRRLLLDNWLAIEKLVLCMIDVGLIDKDRMFMKMHNSLRGCYEPKIEITPFLFTHL